MITLKALLRTPRLNLSAYRKDLAERAQETIAHSAFVWIDTAVSIIPVWSGASVSTFVDLARDISFNLDAVPAKTAPDRTGDGQAVSDGGVKFDPEAGVFSFSYETSLEHLLFNEQFDANVRKDPKVFSRLLHPGPYNFQDQANAVAKDVFFAFQPPDMRAHIRINTLSAS